MSLEHIALGSNLEKMANSLLFRLASAEATSVATPSYHPWQEVERAEEVDAACEYLSVELARPTSCQTQSAAFRVDLEIADLVLWRIRDAQRYLRDFPARWHRNSRVQADARTLLVQSWHSYGERYWLERREKVEGAAAMVSG